MWLANSASSRTSSSSSACPSSRKVSKYTRALIQGYNCCIFAYGQTGAGKTYSILGDAAELTDNALAESRGVLPRLMEHLFQKLTTANCKYQVNCSYLEIYNEQIIDLVKHRLFSSTKRSGPTPSAKTASAASTSRASPRSPSSATRTPSNSFSAASRTGRWPPPP
jgi:hypothetical protein